jgi:fumarylacetoacetase
VLSVGANVEKHGLELQDVELHLPIQVAGFTDFSCSKEHVLNAGEAVFGERFLPPGFLHVPTGYSGTASTIVVSGTPIERPYGIYRAGEGKVEFGPTKAMDYELEFAAIVGKPTKMGDRVKLEDADDHIFGLVLLNDWSGKSMETPSEYRNAAFAQ